MAGMSGSALSRQGDYALVKVDDTGHGMSPEFLRERLFKPFQTTKPAGMGIGAYESFQYVHELGGKNRGGECRRCRNAGQPAVASF
jgi:signal transduction histidine kinase